jgi:hypothetical protein
VRKAQLCYRERDCMVESSERAELFDCPPMPWSR